MSYYYSRSYEDISVKEWLIGIVVLFLAIFLAVWLHQPIFEARLEKQELYSQALQIVHDTELFQYSMKTEAGDVLATGEFVANQPQEVPELLGKFALIRYKKQRYTMHIDTVTTCDSEGHCTTQTIVTYSWDGVGSKTWAGNSFSFSGVEFPTGMFDFYTQHTAGKNMYAPELRSNVRGGYWYPNGPGDRVGNIRYRFSYLPRIFNSTVFFRFLNGEVTNPTGGRRLKVNYEMSIEETIAMVSVDNFALDVLYYLFVICFIVGLYLYVAYKALEVY
jgi:hypothetical protein